ncbi:helix-turn-helix domain-containing protein [Exiguobacterium acetylicum]|uniref:helix-turn-helix domain-containing protein n=1 Tax=Exiguobacterium sp. BMC-KP TaxID=1684312 RepID=UPI0006AA420A|nr:helix-turn-helix transcriptional regulator [Exiguobacterium sp. BMC-KP]KOP30306.1 XRE family transcriptional regulator [Exiguobacterium sp. BMC-KP]
MNRALGKKIMQLRKQHKYTQKYLAEKCGETATTISAYERGQRMPTPQSLERLALALNTTIIDLIDPKHVQHPSLNEFIQQALEPTKPLDLKLVLEDLLVHLSLSKEIYFDGRLISTTVREEMATSIDHALKRGSASIEA